MSDRPYVLALDQGTTSSRCILFDRQQNIVGLAQREFGQHYPKPGWVEHDPMEIYSSQYSVLTEVLAQSGVDPAQVAAIGITNQRETTIVWDRETGRPVYNAIVWQCRRTAALCEELKADDELDLLHPGTHRPAAGCLFFRHQTEVGPGPRGGGKGAGPSGGAALWNGGLLAHLEAHRRPGPRHRLYQRQPYHALRHPAPVLG